MSEAMRILMLEDRPADAELMTRALHRAGLTVSVRRVDRREDFVREVAEFAPDVVLADYTLPGFDALTALGLARKLGPPAPFIVVTGHTDEETAVACLKAGVDDFVLKEQLTRLPSAVQAALASHHARSERRRAEEAYLSLAENSLQGLIIFQDQKIVYVNPAFSRMTGYAVEEMLAMDFPHFQAVVHPDDHGLVWGRFRERMAGKDVPEQYALRIVRKDGEVRWWDMFATNVLLAGQPAIQAAVIDVTDRKLAEAALHAREAMFRAIFDQAQHLAGILDLDGVLQQANATAREMIGDDEGRFLNKLFWETPWWTHSVAVQEQLRDSIRRAAAGEFVHFETTHCDAAGSVHNIDFTMKPVRDETGRIFCLIPEGRDVTELYRAVDGLRESELRFRALFDAMEEGVALHELVLGPDGRPVDYVIVAVNSAYERITGLARKRAIGAKASVLYGTGSPPYLEEFGRVGLSGEPRLLTTHFPPLGRTFRISICCPGPNRFATVFMDVTGTPLDVCDPA